MPIEIQRFMLILETHQTLIARRVTVLVELLARCSEVTTLKRFRGNARYRIRLIHQPPQHSGAAFSELIEQDRSLLAASQSLGCQLRLLQLEQLLTPALQCVL